MPRAKKARKVAVIDFETDPFLFGRVPKPFCVEFYSDERTEQFWGNDCAEQLGKFLEGLGDPHLIFAHNGGKFDFHFLHGYVDNPALIIKSRIVECKLFHHTMRDSYAILPVPLRDYKKDDFDYAKMEAHVREKNKATILDYLHSDCVYLFELVNAFIERFGPQITIGGTAIRELQKRHPFAKCGSAHDAMFRPYFFGGRVQCFQSGILEGPWEYYDVNSMYPHIMRSLQHPINGRFRRLDMLPGDYSKPFFAHIRATSRGALPFRLANGGLSFADRTGDFFACSHELEAGLELGLIDVHDIYSVYVSERHTDFAAFIDEQYERRQEAKRAGDRIGDLFAKLLMNSAYGRFGINPDNFEDWYISRDPANDNDLRARGFHVASEFPDFELWSKKADARENQYADVATAASITSGARAHLLRALAQSDGAIYCDTDSIIARRFVGDLDPKRLGAWKTECTSAFAAIAGKKLYALWDDENEGPVKLSSKGGNLSLSDVVAVAQGERVTWNNQAPSFSIRSEPKFISRNFVKTA